MAATLTTQVVFDAFLENTRTSRLFHGHSYTGNQLGAAASWPACGCCGRKPRSGRMKLQQTLASLLPRSGRCEMLVTSGKSV